MRGVDEVRGGTKHLCGVCPQDTAVGEVSGAGMPGGSIYCETSAVTLNVLTFLSQVTVVQEGKYPLPCCNLGIMHMPPGRLIKHQRLY